MNGNEGESGEGARYLRSEPRRACGRRRCACEAEHRLLVVMPTGPGGGTGESRDNEVRGGSGNQGSGVSFTQVGGALGLSNDPAVATSTEFHTEVIYAPCLRFSVVKCLGIAFFTSIGRLEELWNR